MFGHATRSPASLPVPQRIPVDAHVHFHHRDLIAATLTSAAANFSSLHIPGVAPDCGALLLAQSAREHVFEWVREQSRVGAWSVTTLTAEPQSLWFRSESGLVLVVCGRQVVAEPGLEVLALGTDRRIEDGLGLEQTLEVAMSVNALTVLPWGFGKWTGRRKRRIQATIAGPGVSGLWVGDNGGRLGILPRPRLLDEAEAHGLGVLPGTDPFPFGGDYRRVGSFGCVLDVRPDAARPWESIRESLVRAPGSPQPYGRGAGVLDFALRQAGMQVYKRLNGQPA
jgi:hypothetical protein